MNEFILGVGVHGYGSLRVELPDAESAAHLTNIGGVVLCHPPEKIVCMLGDGDRFNVTRITDVPFGAVILDQNGNATPAWMDNESRRIIVDVFGHF